jgi:hypothetical protein
MKTFGSWVREKISRATTLRRKLIIVGFQQLDHSSHWFNELVTFKAEGLALGLSVRIAVPRATDAGLAATLSAVPVLDPLPPLAVTAENFVAELSAFADPRVAESAWRRLDVEDPRESDLIYFPQGHPILIRGAGSWLAKRRPKRRPSVFFRILGDELTDLETGRFKPRASLYRLACADLHEHPGQERVFFLVNSASKARSVARACCRRPFLMQHHFGGVATGFAATDPAEPTVYVHLNPRSGSLAANLGDIIRRVAASEPCVRFLIRVPAGISPQLGPDAASFVEVLPPEQNIADYLANLARCTMVFLAYEAQPYKALTSGVFTEAASLGKPVVVPAGTWMDEKIAQGYGVGKVFEHPTAECAAAAISDVLKASTRLGAIARQIAPRLAVETGCRRYIENMIALTRSSHDMGPRYQVGDKIDFSDPLDSRCFMREGWGETEPWGVWTIAHRAELALQVEADAGEPLVLNAFASAFVGRTRDRTCVRVCVAGRQIAEWVFDAKDDVASQPRWMMAALPRHERGADGRIDISFVVEGPTSPFAEGLSGDRRALGLGMRMLSLIKGEP